MKIGTINRQNNDLLLGGVPSIFTNIDESYISHGKGGKCYNQEGKQYIDLICGFGSVILGHSNAEINEAVIFQLQQGIMFPSVSPLHTKLTEELCRLYPWTDGCQFFKTGSEAVTGAIRLARSYTERKKIVRCGFHGWHDTIVSPHFRWHLYHIDFSYSENVEGVIDGAQHVIAWDGESLDELSDIFARNSGKVAALIIDPVQLREPIVETLKGIKKIVTHNESLLIFDEVKTGFRVGLSGVQGLYGVTADLTILGKAIANGFPLSAIIGRHEIMNYTSRCRLMGTFNGELLSIAAALKTIEVLEKSNGCLYIDDLGQYFIDGINEICTRYAVFGMIRALPYRWACLPFLYFNEGSTQIQAIKSRFYQSTIMHGLLLLKNHMNFICRDHTKSDIDQALSIIDDAIKECIK